MVSPAYLRRVLALLAVVAVVAVLYFGLRSTRRTATVQSVGQQLPRNIDVSLGKARFSEIKDGQLVWELAADHVDYDKEGDRAYLSDIRMKFQGSGLLGAVTVTADKGEYNSSDSTVRLSGTVRVTSENGAQFETDSVLYSGKNDQISTSDPVKFRQQRMQLTAIGMDLGVKSQQARFHSAIAATVSVD